MIQNDKIYIGTDKPFVLNDPSKLFLVISGEVNIFYTRINENGEYLCPLTFLYSSKKGEIIFSLLNIRNDENIRLILYSNQSTVLSIDKSKLLDIDNYFLKNLINKWIQKTSSTLNQLYSPRIYKPLDNFETIILNKDTIVFPSNNIKWIKLIQGEIEVYSKQEKIIANKNITILPISNKLWIKSIKNETIIKILNTSELLEEDINVLISLEYLQKYLYSLLLDNIKNNEKEITDYFNNKIIKEDNLLEDSLHEIKSIVNPQSDKLIKSNYTHSNSNNILFNVCKVIGEKSGYKIIEPKYLDTYNTTNQLNAIAKSSKIRVRKIILRGSWWKEENGNLLAFYKDSNTPVALLQRNSNTYILKDINNKEDLIINSDIAQQLEPIGYMFFSGFSEKMNSIKKVLNFALNGVKKDVKYLILAAFFGSIIGLLVPILSGIMFDDVIPSADKSLHFDIFVIMLTIGVITAGLQLVQGVLQLRVESKSSVNLQAGVMDHILRLPVSFYKNYTAGDLTNRVLSINSIRQILSNTLITATLSGAFSFVNLILLFYYDSNLAWIGITLGLIAAVFIILIGLFKLKFDRKISEKQGEIQGFLFEFLSGITKIRITGGEKRIFVLWSKKFSDLKRLGFNSGNYQNFVEVFNSSYPLFTNIIFFSFIYYIVLNSDKEIALISVGSFMAFITAFNKFLNDSLKISMAFITSLNVIPLYERVKPILEADPESDEQSLDPGEIGGDIEMNSISFRYNQEQPLVLNNISFKIKQGEMVAFVGSSGSGKSTIMRLLLGFEIPEAGSIYYDENSFDSLNKELVRRQIGVVLQNGSLMSGSIYQNIVGNSELSLDDAWEAAKMSGMEEDIKQMPMEMHTVVSEGAGTFSGGQRQRLMIARAIAHKPRLLFMDEATSALDNKTQNIVSESLDKLQATRIVIAHRLSTIKNADRIYVLDKGSIVESGTYKELMELNGLFSELAKRQIA